MRGVAGKVAVGSWTRSVLCADTSASTRSKCPVVAVALEWVRTGMGGPKAALSVEESAASLAATISRLTDGDAGRFLDRDGQRGLAAW